MNKKIIDAKELKTLLDRMTQQFVQDHQSALKEKKVGIVGIHTRGAILAKRITELIQKQYRFQVVSGSLDITLYRDDVGEIGNQPLVKETDIPFPVDGKSILLVDDVLYTGRTIRAALDALLELGRPRVVRLAVAVDRGERELPIQADYAGTGMQVKRNEKIQIHLKESDGEEGIWITSR